MELGKQPTKKSGEQTRSAPKTPQSKVAAPGATLQPVKSSGSKAWIWILVAVVVVLLIGGIILALVFAGANKVANKVTEEAINQAVISAATEIADKAATAEGTASEEAYADDALKVLERVTNALEKYEAAAEAGSNEDFEASTEALKDGLAEIAKAETVLKGLEAPEGLEQLHDLLKQVVTKTREGLELGITGNETEEIGKIEESATVMQQVADLLERISQEIDRLTAE